MRHFTGTSLSIICAALMFSCSQMQQNQPTTEPKSESTDKEQPPLYLGSVHQVFPKDKFALIRIIGPMPAEGDVLISHPADGSTMRMGNLIVASAGQAGRNIIAADIRGGVVAAGDFVFKYRSISSQDDSEEEESKPEPTLLTDEVSIDEPFRPRDVQEKIERVRKEAESAIPEPAPYETQEAGAEPSSSEPAAPILPPDPPFPTGPGKLDDIPDTINDWDTI